MTDPTEENPVPDKDELFDRFLEAAPDTALPDIDTNLAPESRAAMDEELRAAAQAVPETTTGALTRVLAEHGIGPDGQDGLHSWRCADKVRYPDYCTCVPELVADLLAVVSPEEPDGGPQKEKRGGAERVALLKVLTEALTREVSIGFRDEAGDDDWASGVIESDDRRALASDTLAALDSYVEAADERVSLAEAVADSMDHFADVAVRVEARNNELADRLAKVRALVTDPRGVVRAADLLATLDGEGTEHERPALIETGDGNRMWLRSPKDPDTDIVAAVERADGPEEGR